MIDVEVLEARVERDLQKHHVPGFALAIIEDREIVYARGFGVTSIEHPGLRVTPDTIFCCGSISKSLTAAAIMALVAQGRLDLDEPVTSYVPELTFSRSEYSAGVTLRRLLSHSSGLFGTAGNFGSRDLDSLGTFVLEVVPRLKFVAAPGKVYEYSSLGIDLAGYVAEVVGGEYFPDVVRRYILDPSEMYRTMYDRTAAMTYDVALPHVTNEDGRVTVQHRMFDFAAANPAGQAMASTMDLARFAVMLLNGGGYGGRQVLPVGLVAEMFRPQISLRDAEESGYGLGFFTMRYKGQRWITHGGMLTPYLCELSFLPDEGIGIVFQCNITNDFDPFAIRRFVFDDYLGEKGMAIQRTTPWQWESGPLGAYAGSYLSLAAGFTTIHEANDHLILERQGEVTHIYAAQENTFSSADGSIVVGFVPEIGTHLQYFMLDEHAFGRFDAGAEVEVARGCLEAYAGTFIFDDGDSAIVSIEDDGLYISLSWLDGQHRCVSLSETTFASDVGLVEFRLESQGRVVLVWAGGVFAERVRPIWSEDGPSP